MRTESNTHDGPIVTLSMRGWADQCALTDLQSFRIRDISNQTEQRYQNLMKFRQNFCHTSFFLPPKQKHFNILQEGQGVSLYVCEQPHFFFPDQHTFNKKRQ